MNLRTTRARVAAWCTLSLGVGAAAAAPLVTTAARAQTQPSIRVADTTIRYGQTALVRGTAGAESAGRAVDLEFSTPAGWRVIKTATTAADGGFTFKSALRRSGQVRVALGEATALHSQGPTATTAVRSPSQRVNVAADVQAQYRRLDVTDNGRAVVRGTVKPARAGRLVRLELQNGRRWKAAAHDRTDSRGRYQLSIRPKGGHYARVVFRGDSANARALRRVGMVRSYRPALASRYDAYGGALGCGGSLGYNDLVVAHKSLTCGTKVRIRYHGHVVSATVRDRGPDVGGREFDLAGGVARRLGFNGVGRIWVSVR